MDRWPLHKAYFWETAPFFRILLPFAAGILVYDRSWLSPLWEYYFLAALIVAFTSFTAIVYSKKSSRSFSTVTFLLLNIIVFISGYSVGYFNDIRNNKTWFGNSINNDNSYLARITDIPSEKEHSWKVPVTVIRSIEDGKPEFVTGNVFLYVYKDNYPMMLHKGDSIMIPGKWQLIKNAGNPFEFDHATYCRRNNLIYQQFCSGRDIRLFGSVDPEHASPIDKAHDLCMLQLDKNIPDLKTKGLIQAMLLGDEVNLDEDLRQSYSETGIIHIIAISGGNVAIFFLVISFLLWWLKNKKHLWIKYAIALPLVWFYVLMAGAQPSAIRAAMMFSLLAFSIMLQKNNNSLNQLFATAFLLLCAQPMWLFSVGFQLSFVAVLSLILFYTTVYKWLSPTNKISRLLWGTVAASISAEILVAPLVIYYFHTFPLLFLVANVIAYLFMGVVLVAGIAIILVSFVPVVAKFIGWVTISIVTSFDQIVKWLQGFNPASFHFLVLTGLELILVYVTIAGTVLFLMRKNKPALFTGLSAVCLLFVSFCSDKWIQLRQEYFVVYNTGNVSHAEVIRGAKYLSLNSDTTNQKKIDYATKPSHTMWGAWKKDGAVPNEIFYVKGKTVLLLHEDIAADSQFHVDYVMPNHAGKPDFRRLQQIFSPTAIIILKNYGQKEQKELSLADSNIYSVSDKGAFVIN